MATKNLTELETIIVHALDHAAEDHDMQDDLENVLSVPSDVTASVRAVQSRSHYDASFGGRVTFPVEINGSVVWVTLSNNEPRR